ncbi:pknH-like extracellular domain protein [Mycobacterium kansasii 732]|nr:pknH-like extracellular domain protein [Mycobacterium kansasii 732]
MAAALLAVVLSSGCTAKTGGKAGPAPNMAPHALTGPAINQAMIDSAALAKLLNQPFQTAPKYPEFGGSDKLGSAWESALPADCLGVVHMMQQGPYRPAPIQNMASEMWAHNGASVKVDDVYEGIVALPTAVDANGLFAKFAAQWKKCDGTTLTMPTSTVYGQAAISDVRVMDSVVAATISLGSGPHSILATIPQARALGVRGNCLVEVMVSFVPTAYPSDEGTGDLNTSAIDIAHTMMDKVTALS